MFNVIIAVIMPVLTNLCFASVCVCVCVCIHTHTYMSDIQLYDRVSDQGAMVHGGPTELFLVPASAPRLV